MLAASHERLGGDVETKGNLLVGVAFDRVVQTRATVDARVCPADVLYDARVVVGLAGLPGNQKGFTDVGLDGHVGHQVLAADITYSTLRSARNIEHSGAFFGNRILIGGGVEGVRVAACSGQADSCQRKGRQNRKKSSHCCCKGLGS